MKKIAVVTATRAEYGLLSPVIKELQKQENNEFKVDLIVTGTHLSDNYGRTIKEIDDRIEQCILISVKSNSEADISVNQAETLVKFTELFLEKRYNAVVLLGDRYEIFAIAIAAGNTRTPVFHLCGGDTTQGALDEWIRHSITKISYLHFVTNKESEKRVIQLGEDPERVFNYGSTSIDNIMRIADISKVKVLSSIGFKDCKYALCTYHPVTMEDGKIDDQIKELFKAIIHFPGIQFIITKSNADHGGARINEMLNKAEREIDNLSVFTSLGAHRYLSLMKYAEFVLGNSSSGIIEAPAFHIPTVNVGDRQRGRLQSESIINCGTAAYEIVKAINEALSDKHKAICQRIVSPYGDGYAAEKIAKKIIEVVLNWKIDLKKKFYDF